MNRDDRRRTKANRHLKAVPWMESWMENCRNSIKRLKKKEWVMITIFSFSRFVQFAKRFSRSAEQFSARRTARKSWNAWARESPGGESFWSHYDVKTQRSSIKRNQHTQNTRKKQIIKKSGAGHDCNTMDCCATLLKWLVHKKWCCSCLGCHVPNRWSHWGCLRRRSLFTSTSSGALIQFSVFHWVLLFVRCGFAYCDNGKLLLFQFSIPVFTVFVIHKE
jgi:hypothetical protein